MAESSRLILATWVSLMCTQIMVHGYFLDSTSLECTYQWLGITPAILWLQAEHHSNWDHFDGSWWSLCRLCLQLLKFTCSEMHLELLMAWGQHCMRFCLLGPFPRFVRALLCTAHLTNQCRHWSSFIWRQNASCTCARLVSCACFHNN